MCSKSRRGWREELRPPNLHYLTLVAQTAERAGFHSVLTPVGIGCLDPWAVCSAVAARTSFILAFRPTLASPTLIAQQAEGFGQLFGDRLRLNVVAGGDPAEQAAYAALHARRHPADARSLAAGPNLWAGIGLVRQGVGTALVGSHDQVADRLLELRRVRLTRRARRSSHRPALAPDPAVARWRGLGLARPR